MLCAIRDNVVVKLVEAKQSAGGLFIPANAESDFIVRGAVLAVGDGKIMSDGGLIHPTVRKDDLVVFDKRAAVQVSDGGEKYFILKEDNILCIVKE